MSRSITSLLSWFSRAVAVFVGCFVLASANAQLGGPPGTPGNIQTVAGVLGTVASSSTSGLATTIGANSPRGVAIDNAGNLYYADSVANRIRVVYAGVTVPAVLIAEGVTSPTTGWSYVIAGGSVGCTSASFLPCGDNGPALSADLSTPWDIVVDTSGNVYIADEGTSAVRMINGSTGIISTIAGALRTSGYVDGVQATNAKLAAPIALAFDTSGNLYIADATNHVIRIVYEGGAIPPGVTANLGGITPTVGYIYTIAGSSIRTTYSGDGSLATVAGIGTPEGLAVDKAGNIYISETTNNYIRKVDGTTGIISTIAGTGTACATGTTCGDGGPATAATVASPALLAVDQAGNLYIADEVDNTIRKIDMSTSTPIITAVAGQEKATPSTGGDGGPATSANLHMPYGVALDSQGNIFLADSGNEAIREVYGLQPQTITFSQPSAATYGTAPVSLSASSTSSLPVTFKVVSGPGAVNGNLLTINGAGSVVIEADQAGNSSYSAAPAVQQTLKVNQALLTVTPDNKMMGQGGTVPNLTYTIAPFVNGDSQSNVVTGAPILTTTATSQSGPGSYPITGTTGTLSATNYTFTIATGSTVTVVAQSAQTITFPAISDKVYGAASFPLNASATSNLAVTYTVSTTNAMVSSGMLTITGVGMVVVTANQAGNATFMAATPATQMFKVTGAPLTVTANNQSRPYGSANPPLTYTISNFVNSDTQTNATTGLPSLSTTAGLTSPLGSYTITTAQGTFAAPNYLVSYANGSLTVTGNAAQTISFPAPSTVTYGASAVLSASATSTLPITYTVVSGPAAVSGSTLTPMGAGTVVITASQLGNTDYAAATPVTISFKILQATLTVMATSQTITVGSPIPTFAYTITGFVNADTQATATTGTPALSTTANASSGVGQYPITASMGSLTSTNYAFFYVPGTLTIVNKTAQTITFGPLPNTTYGAPPITLGATASSGIPVTYTVTSFTGAATVLGSVLTINGAGQVTVTANQSGNATYASATPVSQVFTVTPATLTITAMNVSRAYGVANPTLPYTITGFVNGDAQATATTGLPSIATTAMTTSGVGQYPITAASGSLYAANYTLIFVNAILTVTSGTQTITFTQPANATYGSQYVPQATSSAGAAFPITFAYTGPITNNNLTGIGTVTVTASQPGNANVSAASPVTRTFTVLPAVLTVAAQLATRSQGAVNPVFTYVITGFQLADTDNPLVITGMPLITTVATPASSPGQYAIVITQGTPNANPALGPLTAANYTFTFVNSILTVTNTPTFIMVASPPTLNVPQGHTAQTTLSFQGGIGSGYTGSVALACGQLPPGMSCTFSPSTVKLDNSGSIGYATLTLNTNGNAPIVGALERANPSRIFSASVFLLPGALLSGLLFFNRRKFVKASKHARLFAILVLLIGGSLGLGGCGASPNSNLVAVGTYTVMVNAAATGVAGTGSPNMTSSINVTVNVTQ